MGASESKENPEDGALLLEGTDDDEKTLNLIIPEAISRFDIPVEYLDEMNIRFSSDEPNTRYLKQDGHDRISYNTIIQLKSGRHIRLMGFNAPMLMTNNIRRIEDEMGKKVRPQNFADCVDKGMNIVHALALMTHDAYSLQARYFAEAEKNKEDMVIWATKAMKEMVDQKRYKPIVETVKEFFSLSGLNLDIETVKTVIIAYISNSRDALFHSRVAKGFGWGAVGLGAVGITAATTIIAATAKAAVAGGAAAAASAKFGTIAASYGALTAAKATGALTVAGGCTMAAPFVFAGVLVLGPVALAATIAYKQMKTSDKYAMNVLEVIKLANYSSMLCQLRDLLIHRPEDIGESNVCLMAFDDMKDTEEAMPRISRLTHSRADVLSDPKYKNRGGFCDFIVVRGRNAEIYAPRFDSYTTKGGKNLFDFYRQVFSEMSSSNIVETNMQDIKHLLEGSPSPEKPLQDGEDKTREKE